MIYIHYYIPIFIISQFIEPPETNILISDRIKSLEDEIRDMNTRKVDECDNIIRLEKEKQNLVLEVMSRGEQLQNRQSQIANLNRDLIQSYNRLKDEQNMFKFVSELLDFYVVI